MGRKKGKSSRKSGERPQTTQPFVAQTADFPALGQPVPPVPIQTRQQVEQVANEPQIVPTTVPPSVPTTTVPSSLPSEPEPLKPLEVTESGISQRAGPSRSTPTSTQKIESQLAEDIRKSFKPESRISRVFPKRPKDTIIGTPLQLLTNHFLLSVGQKKAYHYDIEIERAIKKIDTKETNVVDKEVEETNVTEKKKNQFTRKLATKLNREIFRSMVELYSNPNQVFDGISPVYDGQKNMFTSKVLKGTEDKGTILRLKVTLNSEGRNPEFYVNIKMAESNEVIDLDILNSYHKGKICDDEALKKSVLFINTLLRHNCSMNWVPIGQSIFKSDVHLKGQELGRTGQLGHQLILCYGFYSSVRNLMVGPTLNIDRSAAAFYRNDKNMPLHRLIGYMCKPVCDITQIPANSYEFERIRRKVNKELSGLQVEATHRQYGTTFPKYRILGLSNESAKDTKFEWKEKNKDGVLVVIRQEISVAEYFERKYRLRLKYSHLPCLEVGNKNNPVKIPIEVCQLVAHQRLRRAMWTSERSEMTRISGQQLPQDRFKMCEDTVKELFHSNNEMANTNRQFLSEFEINVDKNLLTVESTVISAPKLKYRNTGNTGVTPKDGEWEMFKDRATFLIAASLKNWIVINMSFIASFGEELILQFCDDMCAQAKEMGMANEMPILRPITYPNFTPKVTFIKIKENLNKIESLKDLKMILFITPDKSHKYSDEIYSQIKLMGDVEHSGGLTTQCVNISKIWDNRRRFKKWNRSYLRQLMLKINPKLGGTNVALLDSSPMPPIFKEKSIMIVGADVHHPAPGDTIRPSIAALFGCFDTDFTKHYTTVSLQPKSREEMIRHLDEMTVQLLNNYKKRLNSLPQRIIFYRDGVSEGQFQLVIDNEYPLLMKAFQKVDKKYAPKLTFIVVQKRHHTRFMRVHTPSNKVSEQNMPPGTVVNSGVTHKNDFDFYLSSHKGNIGTSRSAHYYVLADENNFSSNHMCKMTYYLCHIYQRCTKSVSIPAPVYYADLAASKAKVHLYLHSSADMGSVASGGSGDEEETIWRQITQLEQWINVSEEQKEKLYFL